MNAPRAVVAEDEPRLADELAEMLADAWPELAIVARARNGAEACAALEREAPDVMFLDIEMPGMSGLDVARTASGRCHIVFVTAYDSYAIDAFEQEAVDYVLKPVTAERLAETVRRLKKRVHHRPPDLAEAIERLSERVAPRREFLRWIAIPEGEEMRLVTMDEICYFQSDSKYTRVVLADKSTLIRRTLKELADELDPAMFWQIHRSTLVNVSAVSGLLRDMGGRVRLRLKTRKETLPVSDPYVHRFRDI